MRFSKDEFFEFQEPTIGAAFVKQSVDLPDGSKVRFEIWDTAGQERYRSLAPMYYRDASVALVVYDITTPESYRGAQSWVKELERRGEAGVIIALAGNKADLESGRKVQRSEGEAYAKANNMIFAETSALVSMADTGNPHNIRKLFEQIARKVPKNTGVNLAKSEAFPISMNNKAKKTSCC